MSKATRSASAGDEADRRTVQDPGEACKIIDIVAADVADEVDWEVPAPFFGGRPYASGIVVQHHEIERLTPILGLTDRPHRHAEWRFRRRYEYDAIGLAQAQSGPSGVCGSAQ